MKINHINKAGSCQAKTSAQVVRLQILQQLSSILVTSFSLSLFILQLFYQYLILFTILNLRTSHNSQVLTDTESLSKSVSTICSMQSHIPVITVNSLTCQTWPTQQQQQHQYYAESRNIVTQSPFISVTSTSQSLSLSQSTGSTSKVSCTKYLEKVS